MSLLNTKDQNDRKIAICALQRRYHEIKELSKMLDEYGINKGDPDQFFWLALALAKDKYPGKFAMNMAGRPSEALQSKVKFLSEVESIMRRRSMSLNSACNYLARKDEYTSKPNTLRNKYNNLLNNDPEIKMLITVSGNKQEFLNICHDSILPN